MVAKCFRAAAQKVVSGYRPSFRAFAPMITASSDRFPKMVRLVKRVQFLFVREGMSYRCKGLVVQARQRSNADQSDHIGDGYTATKKIGNAVVRNRCKRRLKAAAKDLLPRFGLPGVDYVFIARKDTATLAWQRLLDDMETALVSLATKLDKEP